MFIGRTMTWKEEKGLKTNPIYQTSHCRTPLLSDIKEKITFVINNLHIHILHLSSNNKTMSLIKGNKN